SAGRLFDRIREVRGLNYGDYAYIEYFPRGMFRFEPEPNLVRRQQIFQIWIRPVEPASAHFALRLALYELDKVVRDGIPEAGFARARSFLLKNAGSLLKTRQAELGYALDSRFYGIPAYDAYLRAALPKLTAEQVTAAIRKHWTSDAIRIVAVAKNCDELKRKLVANSVSAIKYNSPKPAAIAEEDKIVERWRIPLTAENVRIVAADSVFE
ncbi:MAG: M16 family metallopeptidase, partial [Bryobacteraceae bacterium]